MTATISSEATGRTIDAAGISTHYHEAGSGPPVLLLHGSGPGVSAWANWRLTIPALARDHRVLVAVDEAANAAAHSAAAVAAGSTLGIMVEVDTGMDRCGVDTAQDWGHPLLPPDLEQPCLVVP